MTGNMHTLAAIADRATKLYRLHGIPDTRITIVLDLDAADRQQPIDFAGLLAASDADFAHDLLGIRQHIDRDTGQITGFFVPRYARSNSQ